MKSKLFLSLLTLLGFGSCSDGDGLIDVPDMYGVPLANYQFKGSVTDAEGNPIKGIEVKISSAEDTILTNDKGAFDTEFTNSADGSHTITFTDVDGSENGGEFAEKEVNVEWDDAETVGDKNQYDLGTISLETEEQ